jgi:hypothetical protein
VSANARVMAKGPCGGVGTAERLNEVCFCITLDRLELLRALDAEVGSEGFAAELATSHPFLLSNVPVFVTPDTMNALKQVVSAVEAAALIPDGDGLTFDGRRIDLVYNRLVDFELAEPRHAALRAAYASGSVVVTPNPHVHSLFADKRTLTLLSDSERLESWGLSTAHLDALRAAVPETVVVTPFHADSLWRDRRNLFFKPARGHGSKAAYRGDKLTRRVWSEILAGDYVAQAYAEPSVRIVERDGIPAALKVDIRLYTYAGTAILTAARLYQGQTTNMRTHGGGFAPVLELQPA